MALNIKKGDNVVVIAGKDKGKNGKVLATAPSDNSVIVAGVNIIVKHKKPRSAQDKGGIVKKEGKIDASNVQVICPTCNKATRIAIDFVDNKKVRKCKKCGAVIDSNAKATSKKADKKADKKVEKVVEEKVEKKPAKATKSTTKTTKVADQKAPAKQTTKKTTTTRKVGNSK